MENADKKQLLEKRINRFVTTSNLEEPDIVPIISTTFWRYARLA